MSRVRLLAVLLAFVAAAAWPVASQAQQDGWHTYTDRGNRFSIATPATWQVVPRSDPALRQKIARLRKQGRTALASQYAAVLEDPYQRGRGFLFNAFEWPAAASPITSEVSVRRRALPAGSDGPGVLHELATAAWQRFYQDPLMNHGLRPLRRVQLPAGDSYLIEVTASLDASDGARATNDQIYLLVANRALYQLELRTDAALVPQHASMFTQIVRGLRLLS